MLEFTCPKCRTNSAVATLPPVTVSPCHKCGQPLHIIAEAGEGPRGWGSPFLFAVSSLAGLTVSALIILAWAFFGRSEGERDDPSRVAQESQSNPAKKPGQEKKPGEEKKPPQEDDSLQIAAKPTALTNEQVYQKLLQSCVWIWATDGKEVWTGTGSLVDKEERLVITNAHVANPSCKNVVVLFPLRDKKGELIAEKKNYEEEIVQQLKERTAITAAVVRSDKKLDLALIRLTKVEEKAVPVRLASRSVSPGQRIHTIGASPEKTEGIWNYAGGFVRQVCFYENPDLGFSAKAIESDMSTNHGNSGGPVVDSHCRLVGVHFMGELQVRNVVRHIELSVVRDFLKDVLSKDLRQEWKEPEVERETEVTKEDLEKVLKKLRAADAPARRRAAVLLAELGSAAKRAVPELLTLLRNPQEERQVREAADRALGEIGTPDREDFPALEAALTDVQAPAGHARVYAADALGKFTGQGRQAAQVLVKALDDPEADVRRSVVSALGKIGWTARQEVFAGLVKAIKDKERNVRFLALLNLEQLEKPELADVPTLKSLLADRASWPEGRIYAAWALSHFDAPEFVPPFVDALQNDTDTAVLERAALRLGALKVRSKEVGQALLRAILYPERKVRMAAARALGALGLDETTLPGILRVMQSKDADCRTAVLKAMPSYGALDENPPRLGLTKDALRDLKPLLNNSEPSARAVAAYLLGTLGRDASAVLPELRKALAAEKKDFVQCEQLCALAAVGPEAKLALDELKAVMNDTATNLLLRCLAALVVVAVTDDVAERKPAYAILAKALELSNRQAPAAREKAIHKRAKDALARGGQTAARCIAEVYRTSLVGFGDDKAYARLTALSVLRQIGPVAEAIPVVSLLDTIIRAGRLGDAAEIVQAAKDARAAIVLKR